MNQGERSRGKHGAVLMSALLASTVALGLCVGGRLRVPLRFSRVSPGSAAYYVGPMIMRFSYGATGRWGPPQVTGYEVRVGVFDVQYRKR